MFDVAANSILIQYLHPARTSQIFTRLLQGSHASWKVLDFLLKIPGPGKSRKITLVLETGKSRKLKFKVVESPGKISLKVVHFSSGSDGKQAAIVWHPVYVQVQV